METMAIDIHKNDQSKQSAFNYDDFNFGTQPTDHLFLSEYDHGNWRSHRIVPTQHFSLSPFALCLHYGQTVFEGMKAFRQDNGQVHIFRPEKHHQRFNRSLERMCIPPIEKELFINALEELVWLEQHWIPQDKEVSLYIRPFVFATEPRLGVKVADNYTFCITCTPMGLYYPKPVRVKVETEYIRAAEGGVGYVKCGGNYGAAFYPTQQAKEQGFDQIIWTDAKTHQFLEEAGTMNMMVMLKDTLITPRLSTSILDGVTRNSIIQIARDKGMNVEERAISYQELEDAFNAGNQVELFGVGTAAVISPVYSIQIQGKDYSPYIEDDAIMFQLKTALENIRKGRAKDTHSWNHFI